MTGLGPTRGLNTFFKMLQYVWLAWLACVCFKQEASGCNSSLFIWDLVTPIYVWVKAGCDLE